MARLYEWEAFLTEHDKALLGVADGGIQALKEELSFYQNAKDTIRRKAVQRARNAMNKELRRKAKEKAQ